MSLGPDEKYCGSCGEPIKKAADRCPSCGVSNRGSAAPSGSGTVFCESCGEQIQKEAELCPNCGVRQQGSTTSSDTDVSELLYYGQIIAGAFFILAGLGSVLEPEGNVIGAIVVGILLMGLGLVLLPQVRDRVEKRHPVATFGWTPTVREARVSNPAASCSSCYDAVDVGVRREFGKDFVVAGFSLYETVEGTNHYCEACKGTEERLENIQQTIDL